MSLELRGVSKRFGSVTAASDVRLSVGVGETLALLGPSGCGKSTLLRLVAGLEQPDSGRVLIGGRDVTDLPPQRRGVGMVFQAFALFPHLNVAENIAFGLVEAGTAPRRRAARVSELLTTTGLEGLGQRRVSQLSGGQQQRVALARALAADPATLLLDEPLSNLDEQLRGALKGELARLFGRLNKRTVYVTHDQSEAFALADRVALMRAGKIVQVGSPLELSTSPISGWAARFFGHENVYPPELAARLPVRANGEEVLFRAELAALLAPDPKAQQSGARGRVLSAAREASGWRIVCAVEEWGVNVAWRGYERELPPKWRPAGPEPGAPVLISAPSGAWRTLPGEGTVATEQTAGEW